MIEASTTFTHRVDVRHLAIIRVPVLRHGDELLILGRVREGDAGLDVQVGVAVLGEGGQAVIAGADFGDDPPDVDAGVRRVLAKRGAGL